jgi:hypothetical protein
MSYDMEPPVNPKQLPLSVSGCSRMTRNCPEFAARASMALLPGPRRNRLITADPQSLSWTKIYCRGRQMPSILACRTETSISPIGREEEPRWLSRMSLVRRTCRPEIFPQCDRVNRCESKSPGPCIGHANAPSMRLALALWSGDMNRSEMQEHDFRNLLNPKLLLYTV